MDGESGLESAKTGDIVLGRTIGKAGSEHWKVEGVVVQPHDANVHNVHETLVYTRHGSVGRLIHTVQGLGHEEVAIAARPAKHEKRPEPDVHGNVQALLSSADVVAADDVGEVVLGEVRRRGEHSPERSAHAQTAMQRFLDETRQGKYETLLVQFCGCGKKMPCGRRCPKPA